MTCPACNSNVVVGYHRDAKTAGEYVAWCPAGKCTSTAANEGGKGATPEKAFEDLCAKVEKEQTK